MCAASKKSLSRENGGRQRHEMRHAMHGEGCSAFSFSPAKEKVEKCQSPQSFAVGTGMGTASMPQRAQKGVLMHAMSSKTCSEGKEAGGEGRHGAQGRWQACVCKRQQHRQAWQRCPKLGRAFI